MNRDKIVMEKYSAVFNSAVADKNRRIAEIKTPQKLPAIRYLSKSSLVRYITPLYGQISVKGGMCHIYHAIIRPNIRQRRVVSVIPRHFQSNIRQRRGYVKYTTPPSVEKSVKGGVVSVIPRRFLSKYPSKVGYVKYTTPPSVEKSVKGGVVSDIPHRCLSKYPSKAGFCQLNHDTNGPNIRQRRGCVRYTTPLTVEISVKNGFRSELPRYYPSKYPPKAGCVRCTTPLSGKISVKVGVV